MESSKRRRKQFRCQKKKRHRRVSPRSLKRHLRWKRRTSLTGLSWHRKKIRSREMWTVMTRDSLWLLAKRFGQRVEAEAEVGVAIITTVITIVIFVFSINTRGYRSRFNTNHRKELGVNIHETLFIVNTQQPVGKGEGPCVIQSLIGRHICLVFKRLKNPNC